LSRKSTKSDRAAYARKAHREQRKAERKKAKLNKQAPALPPPEEPRKQ
jgi:hypothetical protein